MNVLDENMHQVNTKGVRPAQQVFEDGVWRLEVNTVVPLRGLFVFFIAATCQVRADDKPKIANPKSSPAPVIIVNLHLARDMKYTEVWRIIDNLQKQGVKHWRLRASNAGEPASAEVVADTANPSARIAAVVKVLLDSGVLKFTVEVKKVLKPAPLVLPDNSREYPSMDAQGRCNMLKHRMTLWLLRRP